VAVGAPGPRARSSLDQSGSQGAPVIPVREVRLSAGAELVVVICGKIPAQGPGRRLDRHRRRRQDHRIVLWRRPAG